MSSRWIVICIKIVTDHVFMASMSLGNFLPLRCLRLYIAVDNSPVSLITHVYLQNRQVVIITFVCYNFALTLFNVVFSD